jgi:hypothetical protein
LILEKSRELLVTTGIFLLRAVAAMKTSITPDRDLSGWKFELLREANGERISGLENFSPHMRSAYIA